MNSKWGVSPRRFCTRSNRIKTRKTGDEPIETRQKKKTLVSHARKTSSKDEEKPNAPQYKTVKTEKKRGALKRHISFSGLYTLTGLSSLSLSFSLLEF
jgi:hypothetical protein